MSTKKFDIKLRPRSLEYNDIMLTTDSNVLQPGHHYHKNFNFIKSRRPWPPILISHLFQHGLFKFLVATFLHQRCFVWNFISFLLLLPLLVFLLKFCFVTMSCGVLANVAVDYFRLISRHGSTGLRHVLNYRAYLPQT